MKNVIKKISSVAMAFTLLGAGAAIAKNNTLKANATIPPQYCRHDRGTHQFIQYKEDAGMGYYIVHYCNCCNICGSPQSYGYTFEKIR